MSVAKTLDSEIDCFADGSQEPSEPDVYESVDTSEVKPPKKRYAPTKGDADQRKIKSCLNLAKARQAKIDKANARKQAELEEAQIKSRQITLPNSESDASESESEQSEEEEIFLTKRKRSKLQSFATKPIPIPKGKLKHSSESRMDRLESIITKIANAKQKVSKPKVIRNTIVQLPTPTPVVSHSYQPQQQENMSSNEYLQKLRRKMFADL